MACSGPLHLRNDTIGTVLDQAGERLLRRHAIDERPEADALDKASKKITDSSLHENRLSLLKCGDLSGQPIQPVLKSSEVLQDTAKIRSLD